eukprot:5556962-Amphidinium_carterae.1
MPKKLQGNHTLVPPGQPVRPRSNPPTHGIHTDKKKKTINCCKTTKFDSNRSNRAKESTTKGRGPIVEVKHKAMSSCVFYVLPCDIFAVQACYHGSFK